MAEAARFAYGPALVSSFEEQRIHALLLMLSCPSRQPDFAHQSDELHLGAQAWFGNAQTNRARVSSLELIGCTPSC